MPANIVIVQFIKGVRRSFVLTVFQYNNEKIVPDISISEIIKILMLCCDICFPLFFFFIIFFAMCVLTFWGSLKVFWILWTMLLELILACLVQQNLD